MAIAGTEKVLTVDANVVLYYFLFRTNKELPRGLKVNRINDFCICVIDEYAIALNSHIRAQYEELIRTEGLVKNWLKSRLRNNKAIEVSLKPLARNIKTCLRDDYGFDIYSKDKWYLETCLNTVFKHLITENTEHFKRRHRSRGRLTMCKFLQRELNILIYTIDECCAEVLNNEA